MHNAMLHLFYPGSIVPYTYLLDAALVFLLIVSGMLVAIFVFLYRNGRHRKNKARLRRLFSDLIAEMTIAELDNELTDTLAQFRQSEENRRLLTNPFARKVLIKELVKTRDSISGKAAENLRWLYEELALDRDSFRSFQTGAWHRKAAAIQHLAEMQQSKYLVKIYKETNNKNPFIRTEAQLAVVKMTGFKGLRFLTIVSHAISQWQQLSFLSHLQEGEAEEDNIKSWLNQKNDSVVEFALRLVAHYRCYDLHDDVIACLQHASPVIRLQALEVLKEIHNDSTAKALLQHFPTAAREEQLCILALLCETPAGTAELDFLTSLLNGDDEAIRFRALQAIQQISPAWSLAVSKQMQDHPSFANILPLLQKEAV